jgi:hypothetical protein
VLSSEIPQYFAPAAAAPGEAWHPFLYGSVEARFVDRALAVDSGRTINVVVPIVDEAVALDWDRCERVAFAPENLDRSAPAQATFVTLPAAATKAKSYSQWSKELLAWVGSHESLELLRSPATRTVSRAGENERDFRARIQQAAREARDKAIDTLRKKYAPRQAALEERLRRAKDQHTRESEQASGQKMQAAISLGATVLGALFGRKAASVGTVGRATTTMRGAGRVLKESRDVERAQQSVEAIQQQQQQLEDEFLLESKQLEAMDAAGEELERLNLQPKKTDLRVNLAALVWMPASFRGRP